MGGRERHCFFCGGGSEDGVAVVAQNPGRELEHARLVVADKDRLSMSSRSGRRRGWCRQHARLAGREVKAKGSADAFLRVDVHGALGGDDDSVHDGEAEAGAVACGFGSEERFEDVLDHVLAHAGAGVADREFDVVPGTDIGMQEDVVIVELYRTASR